MSAGPKNKSPTRPNASRDGAAERPQRTPLRPRATHDLRRALVAASVLSGAAIIGFIAVMTAKSSGLEKASLQEAARAEAARAAIGDVRSARIITDSMDDKCRERSFDNQTGVMVDTTKSCVDPVALDSNGSPVPLGTIHRLDGISKSFSSH